MRFKFLLASIAITGLLASCNSYDALEDNSQEQDGYCVLEATADNNSNSRVGFSQDSKFYWSLTDRLGVTSTGSGDMFSPFDLIEGGGTASGIFKGYINGTIGDYAVYPYSENHTINGTQLSFEFPAKYEYTHVDTELYPAVQGSANNANPAMWSKIENNRIMLHHLGGIFIVKIANMPVKNGTFVMTTSEKLNGKYEADLAEKGVKFVTTKKCPAEEKTVSIKFSNAELNKDAVFYVPAAAGTYNNIRIKIVKNAEEKLNTAIGTRTLNIGHRHGIFINDTVIETGDTEQN